MADDIYGTITSVEDDDYQGKAFKKVTLGTGEVFNVKYGQGGALKAKWPILQVGVAIKFTMGVYNGKPFVQDIATVEGELLPPAQKTTVPEEPPKWAGISADEERRRSVSISYAKDLACHGKIGIDEMKRFANEFLKYMKGEISQKGGKANKLRTTENQGAGEAMV